MGRPGVPVFRLPDVVEREDRPPFADPDALHDPGLVGPDLQLLEEPVRDDVLRMKMADAVQVEH